MKKLKNENELYKLALEIGEKYATNRGYASFDKVTSAKDKTECVYRLLVQDKVIQALPVDQENGPNIKHKLALWVQKNLPANHPLK